MKITKLLAVAAIVLTASTAMAQKNGSDVTGGSVSSTVGSGTFAKPFVVPGLPVAPPTTPVAVTPLPTPPAAPPAVQAAAANVAAVTTGTPAAVASFTQNLQTAGVPAAAAQGVANALQQIGSSPTVGSINAAIATWNSTISTMSPTQVRAFVTSPSGITALRMMIAARNSAMRAR